MKTKAITHDAPQPTKHDFWCLLRVSGASGNTMIHVLVEDASQEKAMRSVLADIHDKKEARLICCFNLSDLRGALSNAERARRQRQETREVYLVLVVDAGKTTAAIVESAQNASEACRSAAAVVSGQSEHHSSGGVTGGTDPVDTIVYSAGQLLGIFADLLVTHNPQWN